MMYNDGSVTNNVRYKNLCVERFAVSVAHNNEPTVFEVVNGTLVDMREKMGHLHGNLVGAYDYISEDDEVLSMFLIKNYNIIINWIDANYTWGWLDDETGMWTGAVGKVNIYIYSVCTGCPQKNGFWVIFNKSLLSAFFDKLWCILSNFYDFLTFNGGT